MDLFREFEIRKRTFIPSKSDAFTMKPPIALNKMFKKKHNKHIKEHIQTTPQYINTVKWIGDTIKIDHTVGEGFFEQACEQAAQHLQKLFSKDELQDVTTVLMVGGFSESGLLQKMIADVLSSNINIITPPDPSLAILKGAVIFGHDPFVMKERRSRFTYGVKMSIDFVTGSHPETKKNHENRRKRVLHRSFWRSCYGWTRSGFK
ncbi:hypothetical protein DPMN_108541 [Dreissena polymorpha]|uniref:Uncharacterized protein n=1 Tax=Dreissena polymorpha TaxID=45954 RepID=A0A9D4K915_DREPO|nr:hypothetical protein DPMN_108541 [Dreissena polymorpha]